MNVLDASLLTEILVATPLGTRLTAKVLTADASLHVPHLLDVEVVQAIRRLTLSGGLDRQRAEAAVNVLADLPLVRHAHVPYLPRIWELRSSMTAYDAAYIALAEGLGAVLLTCDGRLARAHGHRARVALLN
jgi:predicted nucleic acid-binding protein